MKSIGRLLGILGLTFTTALGLAAADRPNILFILADDLGYGDVGCYGQKKIKTPNLDRMATEGMLFTQCYSGSAVCAPSRTTLITGLHTGHTTIRNNGNSVLGADEPNVAAVLKSAGYRTALFGKWGLSKPDGATAPEKRGFDESLAYLTHTQAHDYTPDILWQNGRQISVTSGTYSPDLFTSAALEFIARKDSRPFFLYFPTTFPHAHNALAKLTGGNGMEIPSDAPYSAEQWPQPQKNHAAMITYMDAEVGKLLAALKSNNLEQKTVVFFSSDNGPHREGGAKPEFFDSNGVLRGIKRDLYDGGIRVPMIVRWAGTIQPGSRSDHVAAFWDFLPTAAELAGAELKSKTDGISMLPVLVGKPAREHDYLYWELLEKSGYSPFNGLQQAVRFGKWKAVKRETIEVFDLSADQSESHNVAASNPEILAKATELFSSARTEPVAPAKTADKATTGSTADE